jgi:Fe-S-cluster-containing hydrogenase component 2
MMKKIAIINEKLCDQSPFCPVKRVCPVNAVTQSGGFFSKGFPKIDPEACTGCGKCIQYCPMGAVKIKNIQSIKSATS